MIPVASLFLSLAVSFAGAPQLGTSYQINGTVHSARDGSPISHAHLRLVPEPEDRQATSDNGSGAESFSDNAGHFAFTVTRLGRWVLSASAHGFYQQGYMQHEQYQTALVLSPAAPSLNLDLRLEPDAAIAGSVFDEAGEPVRDAQVALFAAPSSDSDGAPSPRGPVEVHTTDDLGRYELSDLEPGAYRISVSATPWYAAASQHGPSTANKLDVVYPITWYPGATDPEAANTLILQPGDTREADFSLLPLPATHLRVPLSGSAASGRRSPVRLPQLDRISGAIPSSVPPSISFGENGQAEIGGLSPGLYRVRVPEASGDSEPLFLRITTNSPPEVDLSAALPGVHIGFAFPGLDLGKRAQVTLTDTVTGARFDFFPSPPDAVAQPAERSSSVRRRFGGRGSSGRTLDLPAGQYRVGVSGSDALYLTRIDATGATVHGNLVDLHDSGVSLTLHVETHPATVRGICLSDGQPLAGAMVVLVPASLGQTGSIPTIHRDQSDSDGSFLLSGVDPGSYILIAIQNGWSLNWRDPVILEKYLLKGVPLAPTRGSTVRQTIQVQLP